MRNIIFLDALSGVWWVICHLSLFLFSIPPSNDHPHLLPPPSQHYFPSLALPGCMLTPLHPVGFLQLLIFSSSPFPSSITLYCHAVAVIFPAINPLTLPRSISIDELVNKSSTFHLLRFWLSVSLKFSCSDKVKVMKCISFWFSRFAQMEHFCWNHRNWGIP